MKSILAMMGFVTHVAATTTCSDIKNIYGEQCDACPSDPAASTNVYMFDASECSISSDSLLKTFTSDSKKPEYLTAVGNTLYFSADDASNGRELWKSDGTSDGTIMVKDITGDDTSSFTDESPYFTAVKNTLYFRANDGTNGRELWKSDGTSDGTVMVKDIRTGSASSNPTELTAVGDTLYFGASDGTNGIELWKSDGTLDGTVMVKDIYTPYQSSRPTKLTAVGDTLFFSANDGTNGWELWKSDGTSDGTVMVKDLKSDWYSSDPGELTAVDGTLFFTAEDDSNDRELWKSDGTSAGTVMVKDLRTDWQSSEPTKLTAVGDTLYFVDSNVGLNNFNERVTCVRS